MSYLYLHLFPHNSTAVCCSRVYPNRKPAVTLSEGEEVLEAVCGRHVTEHFFLETIKVLMMSNQRCISVSAGIQAASRDFSTHIRRRCDRSIKLVTPSPDMV